MVAERQKGAARVAAAARMAVIIVSTGGVLCIALVGTSGPRLTSRVAADGNGVDDSRPSTKSTTTHTPTRSARWPGPGNTGVPVGTVLTRHSGSGTFAITTPGTVINGADISQGCIDVRAKNVTIKSTRIRGSGCYAVIRTDGATGLLIEDTEIDGLSQDATAFGIAAHNGGFMCLRCNVHHIGVAFSGNDTGPMTIRDSWAHDIIQNSTSHNQDVLSNGSTKGITLWHNRFDDPLNEVSAISLFGDFGPIQNVVVDDNLLNGGAFTIYGGCDGNKPYGMQCRNIALTNNHIMRAPEPGAYWPNGGYWGPLTSFNGGAIGGGLTDPTFSAAHNLTWSGNVWDDAGAPIR